MKVRSHAVSYITAALIAIVILSSSSTGYSKPKSGSREGSSRPDGAVRKYVVRRGDTLIDIARSFDTTAKELKKLNRLTSSRIKAGRTLRVPVAKTVAAPKPSVTPPPAEDEALSVSQLSSTEQPDLRNEPRRLKLVKAGFDLLGVRYRRSGGSEKSGFDCSGLVKNLFSRFDIKLPRTSREQYQQGQEVGRDELQEGDLVFFSSGGSQPTHVGIYVGDNKFIHAARKARRVVVSDLNKIWYTVRYLGARRVQDLAGDEPSSASPSEN